MNCPNCGREIYGPSQNDVGLCHGCEQQLSDKEQTMKIKCPHLDGIEYLEIYGDKQEVRCFDCGAYGMITLSKERNESGDRIELSEKWNDKGYLVEIK